MSTRGPERIGSYRLIKTLGKGHACEIWEVERGSDNQRYAMKLLLPGQFYTRENLASLRHEYTVGQSLDHVNIIHNFEHVQTADGAFILQELFRAPNLKQIIHQGGVAKIAYLVPEILRQAAESLAYLHGRGWVHRDVKPDNFLVDDAGRVKLIDFNLAQKQQGLLGRLLPSFSSKVQGTQSYMSPEQIRGQRTEASMDIYSLGCVFHEIVGGKPPFTGVSTQELLTKHLKSKAPPLVAIEPNTTAEFSALVLKMINKDPAARQASMAEVVSELGSIAVFRVKPTPPPTAGSESAP